MYENFSARACSFYWSILIFLLCWCTHWHVDRTSAHLLIIGLALEVIIKEMDNNLANNLYAILGLEDHSASQRDIKIAYRQLMMQHHPDKTSDPALIRQGVAIIDAYNTLSDPQLRQQYDTQLKQQMQKIANLTTRHYDTIDVAKRGENEEEGLVVQCGQCMGETNVELAPDCVTSCEIFVNCYHCGLLMKMD